MHSGPGDIVFCFFFLPHSREMKINYFDSVLNAYCAVIYTGALSVWLTYFRKTLEKARKEICKAKQFCLAVESKITDNAKNY